MVELKAAALSAAQVSGIEAKVREAISMTITTIQARKLAVQYAIEAKSDDLVKTAQMIYDFITQPANEIVIRIEQ